MLSSRFLLLNMCSGPPEKYVRDSMGGHAELHNCCSVLLLVATRTKSVRGPRCAISASNGVPIVPMSLDTLAHAMPAVSDCTTIHQHGAVRLKRRIRC